MLSDASESGTPGWWLLRLGKRLSDDQKRFDRLESYWNGNPPVPFGNQRMREAYRRLQRMARTNFGLLLVESVVERLSVVGFRAGSEETESADKEAWRQWQANSLDADATLVHRAALIMSRSYVIVGEDEDTPGQPLVTVEDPRQVIHEASPTNRRKVIAALKTWKDDVAGRQVAVVYLPDTVHYYWATSSLNDGSTAAEVWQAGSWEIDESEFPGGVAANTLGKVPVVPFVNRPGIDGEGLGEFEDVTDILDRINTGILDRMVVGAMQAYRQRYATGVEVEDEDGNATAEFDPGADLMWVVPDEKAHFGEFNVTDLTPIVKAIESDVSYLGAISRTPPSYLLAAIVNASGDALAAAEVGLVSKCRERSIEFGDAWENVYRLMSKVTGNNVTPDCEVLWSDPQFRSLSELAGASVQLMTAGVPWRTRMQKLDYTPTEIDRMSAERIADALLSSTLAPLSVAEGGQIGTRGATFAGASLSALGDKQQAPIIPTAAKAPPPEPPPAKQ
ncbi:MAG: Phage portal protein Gp6-like [Pseudonocardia sp.]|nr:Phage portal protein Gp6-like [Pseudonocardia sp.]